LRPATRPTKTEGGQFRALPLRSKTADFPSAATTEAPGRYRRVQSFKGGANAWNVRKIETLQRFSLGNRGMRGTARDRNARFNIILP
jgi:hypothetical protein